MKVKILFYIQFLILLSFSQQTWNVDAGMYYYSPSDLVINQGDIVIWTNAGGCHDVNGLTNSITGQPFNNPESFGSEVICETGLEILSYTFNSPGDYSYDCSVYGHASSGMVATITVNETGCVDDDDSAASLASQWNPSFNGGCEEAVAYFINSGYSCETDLTVLGLSGTINDMCQCTCSENEDCQNDDNQIEDIFGSMFISDCSSLITYLIDNYGYTENQACSWNGAPMFDLGGAIIVDLCPCSCESSSNTNLIDYNDKIEIVMIIDLLGRKIDKIEFNNPILIIYSDGSIQKTLLTN
ncbi:MAG: hypothetical protein CMD26_01230 [Flavobacteriales bacterium]|nr:hypothetical protein [Flavobacteriales bacterium]